jgi:hypothetical protein
MKITSSVSKVIRRRHKTHDLVKSSFRFGIRVFHFVNVSGVVTEDPSGNSSTGCKLQSGRQVSRRVARNAFRRSFI